MQNARGHIRATNDYYPYGLTWSRPEGERARAYQSKEWQQGEWTSSGTDMYDFGARMYDPSLARWLSSDPLAQFDSPYNAIDNNPVVNIDPDGRFSIGEHWLSLVYFPRKLRYLNIY